MSAAEEVRESSARTGRPARISRAMIAEATAELGLEGLTLRAVADRLNVSVPALYHHVRGKNDLMRLAAEHSAGRLSPPEDVGQHWAEWLFEWAEYNRDAFVAEPALLAQYVEGAIPAEAIARNLERALCGLVRQGFALEEARDAYELVTACAIGMAVGAIRTQRDRLSGQLASRSLGDVVRAARSDELTHLRKLMSRSGHVSPGLFDKQIRTVLIGIAVARGEDPKIVQDALRRARRRQRPEPLDT